MYNNKLYFPCINITILNEHAYLKITLILFVKHYAYTYYSTIITPIFISRLSIDVIVLTPSTINYIHISMVMCRHNMLTLPSPFIVLCTVSLTVENVSSIKLDRLHVYTQLYTCIYTHLNKYNQLVIVISYVYSDCLIHLCIIMYLFRIHLSSHIVYKMFKSYNCLDYECTRPLISTTHSQPCHIETIFYFIFHFTMNNWAYYFPKYCRQNYWSFINSKYLLGILTLLTHILVCSLFVNSQDFLLLFSPVCTFYYYGVPAYGDMHMFIFIVYMYYYTMVLLIGNIPLHYISQKSLMPIYFCDVNRVVQFPIFIIRILFLH